MKEFRKNILLIAGTGRNVGKTLFACKLIESMDCKNSVVSIKISPHFHELGQTIEIVKQSEHFQIAKERNKSGRKDSNRLLKAGSKEVYYIQAKDDSLPEIIFFLDSIIPPNTPMIIESGGLREIIHPGLFLMIHHNNNYLKARAIKYKPLADKWIEFDGNNFNLTPEKIIFINEEWIIKN